MLGKMFTDLLLKRTHKTLLIFVGSSAGFTPCASMTLYSATKGFVQSLTKSIAYEVYGSTLDISCY